MKTILSIFAVITVLTFVSGCASTPPPHTGKIIEPTVVDAGCGMCLFGLESEGCSLAIRLDGRGYAVKGFEMDQFGDPHAENGMCKTVRKAKVTGAFVDGKFVASTFEVLPYQK